MSELLPLSDERIAAFHRDGYVVLPGFYDRREIEPIWRDAHRIIGLVIERHGLDVKQAPYAPETFEASFLEVVAKDRSYGGEIYDAVKQIPAFVRIVCGDKHDAAFRQLRPGSFPAVAAGGYGIRIDIPGEERFRADWHQDYPGQFRSLDGLVFWSSLVPVTADLGPVMFCKGSHKNGLCPLRETNPDLPEKTGAYGLTLHSRDEILARYEHEAPLSSPGDLVIIDYQTLHASGHNTGRRARWSMQMRYFNFADPTGMKIGWRGSFASGRTVRDVHPELIVKLPAYRRGRGRPPGRLRAVDELLHHEHVVMDAAAEEMAAQRADARKSAFLVERDRAAIVREHVEDDLAEAEDLADVRAEESEGVLRVAATTCILVQADAERAVPADEIHTDELDVPARRAGRRVGDHEQHRPVVARDARHPLADARRRVRSRSAREH